MSRYIDADALKEKFTSKWILDRIDQHPTADAVEVVRCEDCKYADFDQYDKTEEFDVFCFHFSMGFMRRCDFCSWGERREDGEIH